MGSLQYLFDFSSNIVRYETCKNRLAQRMYSKQKMVRHSSNSQCDFLLFCQPLDIDQFLLRVVWFDACKPPPKCLEKPNKVWPHSHQLALAIWPPVEVRFYELHLLLNATWELSIDWWLFILRKAMFCSAFNADIFSCFHFWYCLQMQSSWNHPTKSLKHYMHIKAVWHAETNEALGTIRIFKASSVWMSLMTIRMCPWRRWEECQKGHAAVFLGGKRANE